MKSTQNRKSKLSVDYPDRPVVFLMGPTASGKTALAIELYQTQQFEIISVDSALIYRDMDIGTAKPDADELQQAPHHLIDFLDPAESYSAAQFCSDATQLINEIHAAGKIPLLVGGTMLYFKSLRDGLADLPESDPAIRKSLAESLAERGIKALHEDLLKVDPITAARLKTTDTQRILRALEVWLTSNKPLSWWHQNQFLQPLPCPILSVALAPRDRAKLHERIANRFEGMMRQGFLDEVRKLYERNDLNPDSPAIKCVGYRQLWMHLSGEYSIEQAVERGIIATRQLAKRQYTWLRSWPDLHWFDSMNPAQLDAARALILKTVNNHDQPLKNAH